MGQKIHPTGFRLAANRNWSSRWYANSKQFAKMLNEDIQVRDYLKKRLAHASVSQVVIERPAKNARITVFSARPGVVIGKKGEEIEHLKVDLQRILKVPVHVSIEEVRKPELDAQLIADSIAQQLEKRIMFRRAMKRAMQNAVRLGAQGIKIMSAGRLNGAEIARTEWYREGRVPLHTLRADIDYGFSEAKTSYGVIGIKVWVFKGEVMGKTEQPAGVAETAVEAEPARKVRKAPPRVPRPAPAVSAEGQAAAAGAEAPVPAGAKPAVRRVRKTAAKPATEAAAGAGESVAAAPAKPAAKRVKKSGANDAATGENKVP
ncbi:MAG: 30S ribosomal protein S3 [Rhodocyclales bacterium CG17_big_fil_post_rev_8_21_14_2_50_68_7]|nr:MAG: 30S ribosomal protein S3 [Rhodocyclales bacterium CG17_big_fil_post_rev_8_21_14_2_50_68_7]